ncbi:MAG: hypothetical protein KF774_21810 [Planctomyces sp.]|nr:hypothetical protein [Planctomyces sp.]
MIACPRRFLGVALFAALLGGGIAVAEERPAALTIPGLGEFRRDMTAASPETQRLLNQGLVLFYAFNHDEAIRSFQAAAALDPDCAMAWWGQAVALGPHINNPAMPPERSQAAWDAANEARRRAAGCTPAEQALVAAVLARYAATPPDDRRPLDEAYAEAMERAWSQHPEDADIGALYAEALMNLRPWDLWSAEGEPRPETPRVIAVLERVLELSPRHPLALHLYIHAVEASLEPGRALDAADRLRDACPGLGHLVHMPSHIDVRTGRWLEATIANERAIQADSVYQSLRPEQGFYRLYMTHNHHMLAFAALMRGESERSLAAVRTMLADIPAEWLEDPANRGIADGFFAAPIEVLVRFGRWDEVLSEPAPPEDMPLAWALYHEARGVAYAAKKQLDDARREQRLFIQAVQATPEDALFGNNASADILAVAEALLDGEILLQTGETEAGLARLRDAISLEDALRYDEPPDWLIPVRHALGSWLLANRRAVEAEQVFRDDLARWPNNGWGLFGLAQSLEAQELTDEAAEVRVRFREVWRDADVTLTAACFCAAPSGAGDEGAR